ncbi:MAG TPA: HD domain-containing protein, partial [Treponemataceae bacterium]|nr:HD domain-containing protein [Treponemataceae bacterium]
IEVTTFRIESNYKDGRHPDKVNYTATIEEDLSRRDFTMNAIAASLLNGHLYDPFAGQEDIKNGVIRTVGQAKERFREDGLRPIRALRFASQLGFKIEDKTLAAIPHTIDIAAKISIERFRDEFVKTLSSKKPSVGLKLMEESGMLQLFLPELTLCRSVKQADVRGFHAFDVLDHLFYSCDAAPFFPVQKNKSKSGSAVFLSVRLRLAALFHDIGKPSVKKTEEREGVGTVYTFYKHEKASKKNTMIIMNRLKFPKAITAYVCHLIREHMFFYEPHWTDAAVRRFLVRLTPPEPILWKNDLKSNLKQTINDLFDLRIADVSGMTNKPALLHTGAWSNNLIEFRNRIDSILKEESVLQLKDLAVSGIDLLEVGISEGPELGVVLKELLKVVIEDPSKNNKKALLKMAESFTGCKKP